MPLTHWGGVTHICVCNLTITHLDSGLLPEWHQAIIWNNAEISLIGRLGTKFRENLIRIQTFSFKKMHLKMLSTKWQPLCFSLSVLNMLKYNEILNTTMQWPRLYRLKILPPPSWAMGHMFVVFGLKFTNPITALHCWREVGRSATP